MDTYTGGSSTLTITGGNNQFAVVYKSIEGPASAATPAGPGFRGAGSLNNKDPAFDFKALDNGQVYTLPADGSAMTIEGGNKQFVVEGLVGPDQLASGGNAITVQGGNNAFVLVDNASAATGSDHVALDGGNNHFVVAINGSYAGGNSVAVAGGNNQYAVLIGAGPSDGDLSLSGHGLSGMANDAGLTLGTAGTNSVTVNGGNNQYVVQYGSFQPGIASSSSGTLPPDGGIMSGSVSGNPFAGSAGTGSSSAAPSSAELGDLLKASPFGRILDIPGVSVDTLLAGFASATAGNNAAGATGNPFGNVAPGSNPFANYGGGSVYGGTTATETGVSAGSGTGMPTTAVPSTALPAYTGYAEGASAGTSDTTATSGSSLTDLLKASPFGAIFNIPGVDPDTVLSGFSSAGGNPFGGDPFAATGSSASGGGGILSGSDILSLVKFALPAGVTFPTSG